MVECHRKILPQAGERPARDLLGLPVNHGDLFQVWDVDINIWPGSFELKGFGFAAKFVFLIEALIGHGIDGGNGSRLLAVAAANIYALGGGVVTQIVSSSFEVEGGDEIKRISVIDVELALSAGDEKFMRLRRKRDTLRIWNAGDGVLDDPAEEIDYFDRVIAQRGNEYAALTGGEMIEAALHAVHGNCAGKDEGASGGGCCGALLRSFGSVFRGGGFFGILLSNG